LPPLEEDDLDANLEPDGLDKLPVPNGDAIATWWKENSNRLAPEGRNILGHADSPSAIQQALELGSLWRRHGLALEVQIRSGGLRHISTDAFSARQRRQMSAVTGQLSRMEA
jgi:hypothetical protein